MPGLLDRLFDYRVPGPLDVAGKLGFNVPSNKQIQGLLGFGAEALPGSGVVESQKMGQDMTQAFDRGNYLNAAGLGLGAMGMAGSEMLVPAMGATARKGIQSVRGLLGGGKNANVMPGSGGPNTAPSSVPSGSRQPLPTYPKTEHAEYVYDAKRAKASEIDTKTPTSIIATREPKRVGDYLGKVNSKEALKIKKQLIGIQKEIDAGHYTPYFDVSKRKDVNPKNYKFDTPTVTQNVPKKPETIIKYDNMANSKEADKRIKAAFAEGKKIPDADRWYFMEQLEKEFINELGPVFGRQAFEERFAKSMAATTGGSSPKANLRMAMYGNYLRYKKIKYPEYAHEMPFPIGGRYAMGNIDMHKKLMSNPIDSKTNPKRHNFRSNFLGDKSSATIDEQMMNLFDPALNAPPAGAY